MTAIQRAIARMHHVVDVPWLGRLYVVVDGATLFQLSRARADGMTAEQVRAARPGRPL